MNGHPAALQRLMEGHPPHGGAHQVLGLAGSLRLVFVNPGRLFPDVDHVEVKGIQSPHFQGRPEGVFVQVRRAGGYHDAVQLVIADVLPDQILAGRGAHVLVIPREHHVRQGSGERGQSLDIHGGGDVGAAVTGINANANRPVPIGHRLPSPRDPW